MAEPVSGEHKVVYLLAGLPKSYDVLVTTLESGSDTVPPMESVTERLLREELRQKDKEAADDEKKILVAKEEAIYMSFLQEARSLQKGLQKVCPNAGK